MCGTCPGTGLLVVLVCWGYPCRPLLLIILLLLPPPLLKLPCKAVLLMGVGDGSGGGGLTAPLERLLLDRDPGAAAAAPAACLRCRQA